MHPSARRVPTPRGYAPGYSLHPTGRARRRWPRAYDGGSTDRRVHPRYAQEFEEDLVSERRRTRRRSVFDELRQSPLRNGLIGLAVAGTAAPLAVNRYQQALRTDSDHERTFTHARGVVGPISDAAVSTAWNRMEGERDAVDNARAQTIAAKVAEYSDFGLTAELAEDIYDMAIEADVDPDVAFGLVRAESSFKNQATSRVGAVGLTQLMPSTARWLEPGTTRDDLRDTSTNLRIGFGYLRQLIDQYDGNENLALTAYNRGPGTVNKILKRGGNPDNGYANFVKTGHVGSHKG